MVVFGRIINTLVHVCLL